MRLGAYHVASFLLIKCATLIRFSYSYYFSLFCVFVLFSSFSAVVELGDDIAPCQVPDTRTLLIANHQSTADVPLLMACFSAKPDVLPNIMWIMDRVFKFTNFGIVSVLHQDFFVRAVCIILDLDLNTIPKGVLPNLEIVIQWHLFCAGPKTT